MSEETALGIGEAFRQGLREYREYRGLRQQDLVDLLDGEHSVKMDRATLARIESGDRKVTVEEAFLLAVVLDVPLPLLLLPVDRDADVALTPTTVVAPWRVWEWMHGQEPLPGSDLRRWHPVVQPAWLYSDVRDAQKAAQEARQDVRVGAKAGAGEAELRDARRGYAQALRLLDGALRKMERAGLPTSRLLAEDFRADMVEFGVREEAGR